jgi:hypothetical protein
MFWAFFQKCKRKIKEYIMECSTCYGGKYSDDPNNFAIINGIGLNGQDYNPDLDPATKNTANSSCGDGNFPAGAKYLGIISENCIDYTDPRINHPPGAPKDKDGIHYVFMRQDTGSDGSILSDETKMKCGQPKENWECNIKANHHTIFARDWNRDLKKNDDIYDGMAYCCSHGSMIGDTTLAPGSVDNSTRYIDYNNNKGNPRQRDCPNELLSNNFECLSPMAIWCNPQYLMTGDLKKDTENIAYELDRRWIVPELDKRTSKSYCVSYIRQAAKNPELGANIQSLWYKALDDWSNNSLNRSVNDIRQDPFLTTIKEMCGTDGIFAGKCQEYLKKGCSKVTMQDLQKEATSSHHPLNDVCACHLPDDQYKFPGIIPLECNATCNLIGSTSGIPLFEYSLSDKAFSQKTCKETNCIIDDTSINLLRSNVDSISFNQLCNNESNADVTCIMDNISVNVVDSSISGGINMSQRCGGCSSISKDGKTTNSVPCTAQDDGGTSPIPLPPGKTTWEKVKEAFSKYKWWILSLIIFLIVVVVAMYGYKYFFSGSSDEYSPYVEYDETSKYYDPEYDYGQEY